MLYTKKIEDITSQDVLDFCSEQIRENISLDYKEAIDASLAKTIAAMANTWGGLIIIGVKDKDSKPELPVKGVELKEHLREQINNIILGNITPPVFPEIQVCGDEKTKTALIVIRVPQSNTTPHAIRSNTRVYLRTDTSNEPEELASVDRVLWLVNRRGKSIELKNSFYEKAESRLKKLTNKKVPIENGDLTLSSLPLYPYEALVDYRKLRNGILEKISCSVHDSNFPLNLHHTRFEPTQYGSYSLIHNKESGFISYEELNHYGLLYHREDVVHSEKKEEQLIHWCYPISILTRFSAFIESALKYYSILGYWGYIDIKLTMDNVGNTVFTDLPPPRGKMKFDRLTETPIDNKLTFNREILFRDLEKNPSELAIDVFVELAWALGFTHMSKDVVRELLETGW